MTEKLKGLLTAYEEKSKALQELIAKPNRAAEETQSCIAMDAELKDAKGQIDAERKFADIAAGNQLRMDEIAETGVLPQQTGVTSAGVGIHDGARDGAMNVDRATGKQVSFMGERLTLTEKQLNAISTKSYWDAFNVFCRTGLKGITGAELKVLQEGQDDLGGYLAPDEIMRELVMKEPAPTRVAGLVRRFQTSLRSIELPRVNYTTDDIFVTPIRETATGEIPASATEHRVTDTTFGLIRINVHTKMMSQPITADMIEDSVVSLVPFIATQFGIARDQAMENEILNGTGVNQAHGILLNPGGTDEPGQTDIGAASIITADGVIDVFYSIPEQYTDSQLTWVMNRTNTGAVVAKLKDAENNYLFSLDLTQRGIAGDRPGSLIGAPIAWSSRMPNQGSNTYPVVFGDLKGYYLAERVALSITVAEELLIETNQKLIVGRFRFGGVPAEPWKMRAGRTPT